MSKIRSRSGEKVCGRARYHTGILYVVTARVTAWRKLPYVVKKKNRTTWQAILEFGVRYLS